MRKKIIAFQITEDDYDVTIRCPCEIMANYQDQSGIGTSLTLDAAISILVDTWLEANCPNRFNGIFGWDEILCMLLEESISPIEDRQLEHVFLEIETAFPFVDTILRNTLDPLKAYKRQDIKWVGNTCVLTVDTL